MNARQAAVAMAGVLIATLAALRVRGFTQETEEVAVTRAVLTMACGVALTLFALMTVLADLLAGA